MKHLHTMSLAAAAMFLITGHGAAQHLWWDTMKLDNATCLYGEITVLATHHPIYYCGANWHPGEPAGGYCGIQHNSPTERRTIFSIWDTSPTLHPKVTAADPQTVHNRFGGEGEGGHTHMLWPWQAGDTFRFFVRKLPGTEAGTTDTRYYIHDPTAKKWRHSATITNPNGDKKSEKSVASLGGGGLASFLENFGGTDRQVPKLALYRLWLGSGADDMTCLTQAQGDGTWGQLHDAFFLAEGASKDLDALFAKLKEKYGTPAFGTAGKRLGPLSNKPLPDELKQQLKALSGAAAQPGIPPATRM
ncbi:MAG: DUF3472 domain-containing protein [Verrucomicrobia bacterium]|nr:DUF3472 domain-containing protein [Verrucomicrobiota bacterium]